MNLVPLDHSSRMHIEKTDSEVKMKKEICENLHFFSTCDFHDFFNFMTDFCKIKKIQVNPYLKRSIKKQLSLEDFENKIKKRKEERKRQIQKEREQKKYDTIMLARRIKDIDLSSEETMDVDSASEKEFENTIKNRKEKRKSQMQKERKERKQIKHDLIMSQREIKDIDLIADFKRNKRIDFFKKEYHDKLFNNIYKLLIVNTFFLENTTINSEDFFNEIDNIKITERKLNQWIMEKKDEIEDRTKIKILFVFNIIHETIAKIKDQQHIISEFTITKSQFPSITNFPDLTCLYINHFKIDGFKLNDRLYSISQCVVCRNLVSLNLTNSNLNDSSILYSEVIIHCINLENLYLTGNSLTEIPPLPSKIQLLNISENQLDDKGIQNISFLKNLTHLYLIKNKLKKIPILPFLEILYLDDNQIRNEEENDQLKFFSRLEFLSISHNELTKPFSFIPHTLNVLNISHNKICGRLHIGFQGENKLTTLEISENPLLSKEDISILLRYLSKGCEVRTDFGTYTIGFNDSHLSHDTNNEKKERLNDKMDLD